MAMRSTRFIGDEFLNGCQSGEWVMESGDDALAVMRVQEALRVLGYDPGGLDGVFGPNTGTAVSAYKADQGLSPTDPVVGPGTSTALDDAMFFDPPYFDPWFGELASYVLNQVVEPFIAFELNFLVNCTNKTVRKDTGWAYLEMLRNEICLAIVSENRTAGIPDLRVSDDTRSQLANIDGSAITVPFTGPDAIARVCIGFRDITIMGRRYSRPNPHGKVSKVTMRGSLIHELLHLRNADNPLQNVTEDDPIYFVDPPLAQSLSATSGILTRVTFFHFLHEFAASYITWIGFKEDEGNPDALQFLSPTAFAEAAYFYFTDTNLDWFRDNGYIAACVRGGDLAIYRQTARWLRAGTQFTFSDVTEIQDMSVRLFWDAGNEADRLANDPSAAHVVPLDGVYPGPNEFVDPP
ncbi:MAG: peptidoglycan-binding domain-containing protein [Mycobacterium sp.]